MTPREFTARHNERYRKVLYREMSLNEALRDDDEDWQALRKTCVAQEIKPPWYPWPHS